MPIFGTVWYKSEIKRKGIHDILNGEFNFPPFLIADENAFPVMPNFPPHHPSHTFSDPDGGFPGLLTGAMDPSILATMDRDALKKQIENMKYQASMERWPLSKSIAAWVPCQLIKLIFPNLREWKWACGIRQLKEKWITKRVGCVKSDSERGNSAEKVETWAQDVQFFLWSSIFSGCVFGGANHGFSLWVMEA